MEFKAKKSLGQNFLKSKSALRSILTAGDIKPTDIILEVGPGKGVLTEGLLEQAAKVFAVEKDDRLIKLLQEKFKVELENGKLELIHDDILLFDAKKYKLRAGEYKLVANIPYYITGQLIRQFLESDHQPSLMVLMLQKEVAKRIIGQILRLGHKASLAQGKESILSLSVKAYGEPKYIETVPARYFSPAPNVDSAILLIQNISKNTFAKNKISERHFFHVIKTGLAHKRKVLIKNLEDSFDKEKISSAFAISDIHEKTRGEDLSLSQWLSLAKNLS